MDKQMFYWGTLFFPFFLLRKAFQLEKLALFSAWPIHLGPHIMTICSATLRSSDSAEWMVVTTGPQSYGHYNVSLVTWSKFKCLHLWSRHVQLPPPPPHFCSFNHPILRHPSLPLPSLPSPTDLFPLCLSGKPVIYVPHSRDAGWCVKLRKKDYNVSPECFIKSRGWGLHFLQDKHALEQGGSWHDALWPVRFV